MRHPDSLARRLRYFLVRLRHSSLSRRFGGLRNLIVFKVANRLGRRDFHFVVEGAMGMGAMLTQLVLLIRFLEERALPLNIHFTNPLYASRPGEDWLDRYFTVLGRPANLPMRGIRIPIRHQWTNHAIGMDQVIGLAEGREIFHHYVRFRDEVVAQADRFAADHFRGEVLGIHYRATDKVLEAASVTSEVMIAAVERALSESSYSTIFLATDDPGFELELRAAVATPVIVTYRHPDMQTIAGQPLHFSDNDGHVKALDALVQILLLARCPALVRTASYLSGWASVVNPAQKVALLNELKAAGHSFPDTDLAALMRQGQGLFAGGPDPLSGAAG